MWARVVFHVVAAVADGMGTPKSQCLAGLCCHDELVKRTVQVLGLQPLQLALPVWLREVHALGLGAR